MASQTLPLPSDGRVTAIRGLISILRQSHDLKRVVRTWRVWDGSTGEAGPPEIAECPWIRITATPAESGWYADGPAGPVHAEPIALRIETAVSGTNLDNSVLLWAAIERAIFSPGMAALATIGISGAEVRQPAWGSIDADSQMITGDGTIMLTIYINT